MAALGIDRLLDAIDAGDLSQATCGALLDVLREDEGIEDERVWDLIYRHVTAIPVPDVAYSLARIVSERSMDPGVPTYVLTTFLRRPDATRDCVDGALWSLVWLTACERSDTGAIEDALSAIPEGSERYSLLVRALDIAFGASSFGAQLQAEARARLRWLGVEGLLADAARHLAEWQIKDVAAALSRAGIQQ